MCNIVHFWASNAEAWCVCVIVTAVLLVFHAAVLVTVALRKEDVWRICRVTEISDEDCLTNSTVLTFKTVFVTTQRKYFLQILAALRFIHLN